MKQPAHIRCPLVHCGGERVNGVNTHGSVYCCCSCVLRGRNATAESGLFLIGQWFIQALLSEECGEGLQGGAGLGGGGCKFRFWFQLQCLC